MRELGGFYLCYKMILSDSGRPETGKETRLITVETQLGKRTAFGWCRMKPVTRMLKDTVVPLIKVRMASGEGSKWHWIKCAEIGQNCHEVYQGTIKT